DIHRMPLSFPFLSLRLLPWKLFLTGKDSKKQVCPYCCGTDRIKSKQVIGRLTDGIVNTTNDLFDVEDLFGDLACHNVAIIAVGHSGEGISLCDTGSFENLFVDAVAHYFVTTKFGGEALEGIAAGIDNTDRMPCFIQ